MHEETRPGEYDPEEYWTRRLAANWSLQGVGYIGYSVSYNQWLYRAKARAVNGILRKQGVTVRGTRALDIGSGVGFWIDWYASQGAQDISGVELSTPAVARLRSAFPAADIRQGDITRGIPFDDSFDFVSAFDVLYHIVDDTAFARALRAILDSVKPGGWLLLSDRLGNNIHSPAPHVRLRPLSTYARYLASERFCVVRQRAIYRLLNGGVVSRLTRSPTGRVAAVLRGMENVAAPVLYALDALPVVPPNLRLLLARRAS